MFIELAPPSGTVVRKLPHIMAKGSLVSFLILFGQKMMYTLVS